MANRLKPLGTDIPEAKPQKVNRGEKFLEKRIRLEMSVSDYKISILLLCIISMK